MEVTVVVASGYSLTDIRQNIQSLFRCQQVGHLLHGAHPFGEHEPVIDRH